MALEELTGSIPMGDFSIATYLAGLSAALLVVALAVIVGFYVYLSLVFMNLSKKAKKGTPGLAWIPFIGPVIVSYQISGMHWWPWLLVIGFFIPVVQIVAAPLFGVFQYIWMWKTFEAVKRPGWWALIPLVGLLSFIPVLGQIIAFVGFVAYLILLGVAAWGKKRR